MEQQHQTQGLSQPVVEGEQGGPIGQSYGHRNPLVLGQARRPQGVSQGLQIRTPPGETPAKLGLGFKH
jgi:hypothetical protein